MINATKLLTYRGQPSIVYAAEEKNKKNFTVYLCTFFLEFYFKMDLRRVLLAAFS